MSGDEFAEVWLLVALAVLFIDLVVMYLMIKTGEKIHEERIKKDKRKRTGLKPVLVIFLLFNNTIYGY